MSSRGFAAGRNSYLIAAICFALMALMLFPLVMSLLTSVKPAARPRCGRRTICRLGLASATM